MPPTPAPAAAFPTPPPRPAPSQPSPQHPLDDIEDLDPPPSEAELNTNSDNRWLDLWRSVMDTAKTDPTRVPTPRELGELDPLPALDISRMEQTKAILTNLDPALPPSHADLLAECWELRTMDMDEPIAFELPSPGTGITWHGVRNWFPRPHPWPVAGGHPEAGSGTASHHAVMYVHGTTPDRMRRMSYENMIRPAAWRPENHDYPSFGCYAQATPTACNPDTLGQLLQNFTIGKSQLGHRFWGTALCQSAQDLGVRGKPRGPAQRAAPLCMPQRQEVVPSLQVCHAERCRAAAPGVAGREPYHIPHDQEKN